MLLFRRKLRYFAMHNLIVKDHYNAFGVPFFIIKAQITLAGAQQTNKLLEAFRRTAKRHHDYRPACTRTSSLGFTRT